MCSSDLKEFIDFIFKDENIKSISLTVFDFNQNAKRIYDKLGFEIDEVIETQKLKYIMRKHRYIHVRLPEYNNLRNSKSIRT